MTKRNKRKFLLVAVSLLGVGTLSVACAVLWVGSALTAPAHSEIGEPPTGLSYEPVSFASESGATVRGWFIPGGTGTGAVVLMHGIRGNRLAMLARARFLSNAGYSVLLFDFQAHGESHGEHITFGHLESRDAEAAVRFVRSRVPDEPIAVIGTSLGGAAALLGDGPLRVEAMVLEAVYPDVRGAVADRLHLRVGSIGSVAQPLLLWQLRPRLGVAVEQLSPIQHIRQLQCPLLVIAGTHDMRTTIKESRGLYEAAPSPKHL